MQRLYKRGLTWWAAFKDASGRRIRKTTGARDRKAAEQKAAQLEREALDPKAASSKATLEGALDALLHDREAQGRSDGTIDMYTTKKGVLLRVLGDIPLAQIGPREVDRYIQVRLNEKTKRTTIGKELTTLRSTLKLARRRGE